MLHQTAFSRFLSVTIASSPKVSSRIGQPESIPFCAMINLLEYWIVFIQTTVHKKPELTRGKVVITRRMLLMNKFGIKLSVKTCWQAIANELPDSLFFDRV